MFLNFSNNKRFSVCFRVVYNFNFIQKYQSKFFMTILQYLIARDSLINIIENNDIEINITVNFLKVYHGNSKIIKPHIYDSVKMFWKLSCQFGFFLCDISTLTLTIFSKNNKQRKIIDIISTQSNSTD